ncbi:MAG: hypothetical protein JSR58_04590 [Verrucomicrobia bacterium]|nr:hypothetical protein [Verrucomicrobiota bacterium]
MSSDSQYLTTPVWGLARNLTVDFFMYPFEVMKLHQQRPGSTEKSYQIAQQLFKTDGFPVFYRGFKQEIGKTCLKAFAWPMVIEIPRFLNRFDISPLMQQAMTGFTVGFVSAIVSTPLESRRIGAVAANTSYSLYKGFFTHLAKLSTAWMVFLVAQQQLRHRCLLYNQQEKLSTLQLAGIGTSVALLVSLATAPFDVANTRKMGHNESTFKLPPRLWFRGMPLSAFVRVTNSIASVFFLDWINRTK